MCSRFSQRLSPAKAKEVFDVVRDMESEREEAARHMVRPRNKAEVIRADADGKRFTRWMEWGLIPPWEQNPQHGKLINCRSETAAKIPMFRRAFREQRCLIPISGYFEWSPEGNKDKQGWYLSFKSGEPIGVAGLWETWIDEDGKLLETFTVLMVDANEFVSEVHPKQRMPAILFPDEWPIWLAPDLTEPEAVQPLLRTCESSLWQRWAVTPKINGNKWDGPEALLPIKPPRRLFD